MLIDIITVFPEMISAALDHSIVRRARERGLVTIRVVNLRDYTEDRHKTTDDMPYGGGGGMVMKIEPISHALNALTQESETFAPGNAVIREGSPGATDSLPPDGEEADARPPLAVESETAHPGVPSTGQDAVTVSAPALSGPRIVLTDPRGPRFTQEIARQWAQERHIIILCGHYEGVDERVRRHLVTDEISLGDYILTGGELPALILVDALTRLQPGALGDAEAPEKDSFAENLLEYPHYTRPQVFHGWAVPDILLSGHHALIERWRRWHQLRATQERRPDLFARLSLSPQDIKLLASEEPTAPPNPKASPRPAQASPIAPEPQAYILGSSTEETEGTNGTGTGDYS